MISNLFKKVFSSGRENWFSSAMRLLERSKIDDSTWTELEELLISADVGIGTTETIIERIKKRAASEKMGEGAAVRDALKTEIVKILDVPPREISHPQGQPEVVLVVGVNGSGKTTSIAKLAFNAKNAGQKVLLAAADTFRAAASEQLKLWGDRLNIDVIAHQPGADPGAVVFDALQAARSRGIDRVIIDTAGRLHTKTNLMEELKKIKRVAAKNDPSAPHEVILVLDATTGQNGLSQAKYFTEAVGVTGIVLTKLDGTARGGIVLAICDELKIPIRFIGVGEKMEDLLPFNANDFVEALCS